MKGKISVSLWQEKSNGYLFYCLSFFSSTCLFAHPYKSTYYNPYFGYTLNQYIKQNSLSNFYATSTYILGNDFSNIVTTEFTFTHKRRCAQSRPFVSQKGFSINLIKQKNFNGLMFGVQASILSRRYKYFSKTLGELQYKNKVFPSFAFRLKVPHDNIALMYKVGFFPKIQTYTLFKLQNLKFRALESSVGVIIKLH